MAQQFNFEAMSIDTLWRLHEEMRVVLAAKMAAQQQELDDRLRDLEKFPAWKAVVAPDTRPGLVYRNPDEPSQTWSGRGLRPRWMVFQLAAGRSMDEFLSEPDAEAPTPRDHKPKRRA